MPRVLYGVSPIGLGHATRSLVVVRELQSQGAEVRVFSGGKAAEFMRGQGVQVDDLAEEAGPRTVDLEVSRVSLWYVRAWLAQRRNVDRVAPLMKEYDPDVVVGDEEFSAMAAAEVQGRKRAFISDELSLGFARGRVARWIEGRVGRWYSKLQGSVDLLIIPEKGTDSGNRRFVGPIVRGITGTSDETRARHGIPKGRVILLSLSGTGVGVELAPGLVAALSRPELVDATLVVTGNRGPRLSGGRVIDLGVVADNQDLVACADLVVSTAGKSTIDEAASSGTPIIAIPIRHHAEQERNASAMGYSADDAARLGDIVLEKIGKRGAPIPFQGEKEASRLILFLAGRRAG